MLKKLKKIFLMLIWAVIGAVGGFAIAYFDIIPFFNEAGAGGFSSFDWIVLIVSLIVSFILGIVLHELGHLVFGFATGYTFGFFKLGSLSWFKEDDKIKFARSKNFAAGQCVMLPTDNEAEFKFVLYNLGGVIFNILTGAILLIIWFVIPSGHFTRIITMTCVVINFYFGIVNVLPIKSMGNDGANIREALKSEDGKRAFYLVFYLNGELMKGKRMSELDIDIFRVSENPDVSNFFVASVALSEAEYWIGLGDYNKALAIYEKFDFEKFPPLYQSLMHLSQLQIYTTYLPDYDKAREIYEKDQFQQFLKLKLPQITSTLVAYEFFVESNAEKAKELFVKARHALENLPNKGERLMGFAYLQHLEEKMKLKN